MPELDFVALPEDEHELIDVIFQTGLRAIPDHNYMERRYDELSEPDALRKERPKERMFFMVSDRFTRQNLEMRQIKGGHNDGAFFIGQRNGGPAIHLMLNNSFVNERGISIVPSSVSYYPTYWDLEKEQNLRPPEELVKEYGRITRYIRKHGTLVKGKVNSAYVLPHAMAEREAGRLHIGGVDPD